MQRVYGTGYPIITIEEWKHPEEFDVDLLRRYTEVMGQFAELQRDLGNREWQIFQPAEGMRPIYDGLRSKLLLLDDDELRAEIRDRKS